MIKGVTRKENVLADIGFRKGVVSTGLESDFDAAFNVTIVIRMNVHIVQSSKEPCEEDGSANDSTSGYREFHIVPWSVPWGYLNHLFGPCNPRKVGQQHYQRQEQSASVSKLEEIHGKMTSPVWMMCSMVAVMLSVDFSLMTQTDGTQSNLIKIKRWYLFCEVFELLSGLAYGRQMSC
jgi:hypothetical protein